MLCIWPQIYFWLWKWPSQDWQEVIKKLVMWIRKVIRKEKENLRRERNTFWTVFKRPFTWADLDRKYKIKTRVPFYIRHFGNCSIRSPSQCLIRLVFDHELYKNQKLELECQKNTRGTQARSNDRDVVSPKINITLPREFYRNSAVNSFKPYLRIETENGTRQKPSALFKQTGSNTCKTSIRNFHEITHFLIFL